MVIVTVHIVFPAGCPLSVKHKDALLSITYVQCMDIYQYHVAIQSMTSYQLLEFLADCQVPSLSEVSNRVLQNPLSYIVHNRVYTPTHF